VRMVLDTNILIGALITKGTPPNKLYQAWLRGEIELAAKGLQTPFSPDTFLPVRHLSPG
jgi:uncharacterized protein